MHIHPDHVGNHDHSHNHTHTHEHTHDGVTHSHAHDHAHTHDHSHPHEHDHLHDHVAEHNHSHEHTHEHTHDHDCGGQCSCCGSQCSHTPMEELVALMKYMANHNTAHAQELAQLAAQLEKAGDRVAFEQVMAAVADYEKGNMRLQVVLSALQSQ